MILSDYVLPPQHLWTFEVLVCPLSVTERFLSQPLVCGTVFHHTSLLPPLSTSSAVVLNHKAVVIGYWHDGILSSFVCLSICLSVCLSVCDAVHCGYWLNDTSYSETSKVSEQVNRKCAQKHNSTNFNTLLLL